MKRRRAARELNLGDPDPGRYGSMILIPGIGEAGPSNWEGKRWIDDDGCMVEEKEVDRMEKSLVATTEEESREGNDTCGEELSLEEISSQLRNRSKYRRQRSIPIPISLLLPTFLLPWMATAEAAPPPTKRETALLQRITPPPKLRRRRAPDVNKRAELEYLTDVVMPTDLPNTRSVVLETNLPYVLTKLPDGTWSKIDNGWSVFGRQAGATAVVLVDDPSDPSSTGTDGAASTTWAVEQTLPTGWGQTSNRTDFYKVPLIAVASVIMAVGIVAGIIIIVLNRRKAHRRAKRRAERARRKALAAAGLDEDQINGTAANVALTDKLKDLEVKHRSKVSKRGPTALVRTKVRAWNNGIRRRRGKPELGDIQVIHEDPEEKEKDIDHIRNSGEENDGDGDDGEGEGDSSVGTTSHRGSTTSNSDERPSSGETDNTTDSPTTTTTTDSAQHSPNTGAAALRSAQGDSGSNNTNGVPAPYFPPAYRPASVRSLQLGDPSSPGSSGSGNSAVVRAQPREKINAPGYYPAPANSEAEEALAIVSQRDGKSRINIPVDNEEEERLQAERSMRHIATDDKGVLERLRMEASSAPSVPSSVPAFGGGLPVEEEGVLSSGPSAPHIELDEAGFERFDIPDLSPPAPEVTASTSNLESNSILPPPPIAIRHKSSLRSTHTVPIPGHTDIVKEVDETLDELNLIPSAPPGSAPPHLGVPFDIPSAPPIGLEDEDEVEMNSVRTGRSSHVISTSATIPSAPPLDDDNESEGAIEITEESGISRHGSTASTSDSSRYLANQSSTRSIRTVPPPPPSTDIVNPIGGEDSPVVADSGNIVFLPKYEP